MGGDSVKAETYARELEAADRVAGARAREILMPEDADYEAFWKGVNEAVPDNAEALQALGRVYLFLGDVETASTYYREAMALDPAKHILYLDLGRYQMMQAMQNPAVLDSVAPLAREQFNRYLASEPEPPGPMKAWTYGMLAMMSRRSGDAETAEEYVSKAEGLDPYFQRSFGRPDMELYCPPDAVIHEVNYYLTPF
jgi:tetratricopeptide (TPR) repeat protein